MDQPTKERMTEEDAELLAKLEEQNKLIERDSRRKIVVKAKDVVSHSPPPKVKSALNHAIEQVAKKLSSLSATFRKSSNVDVATTTTTTPPTEEDVYLAWGAVIANWDENVQKRPKHVRQLVRDGIPEAVRGLAWQLLSKSFDSPLKETYGELLELSSPCEKIIQRDIARTFPQHDLFKEQNSLGQEALFNVVKAYSLHDREVGYCQGSPFIVGMLLMAMPEEEAFSVFVKLMEDYGMRPLFTPSMAHLNLCFYLLEHLMQESVPDLYLHFQAQAFYTSLWASSWFLTMFATSLPVQLVLRIMDLFFLDGMEILFKFGIALLECSKAQLLQLDMEGMQKHFQKEMRAIHERNPEQLIAVALQVKYNTKKMKRVEREYEAMRLRATQESEENTRLRSENRLLQDRVTHLELESSSLAGRLIERQVDLAQEAEGIFVLKRELAEVTKKLRERDEKVVELKAADEFLSSLRSKGAKDLLGLVDGQEVTSDDVMKLRMEIEVLKKKDRESQRIIRELQDEKITLRRRLALEESDGLTSENGAEKVEEWKDVGEEIPESEGTPNGKETLKDLADSDDDEFDGTRDSEESLEKQWV
ncbi:EVI5-like protein [Oscarella lobularis]|uniref:EVI5-like protein n=1 Tax=Oscarella lobularis TaxID=121494 RepID=UPI003313D523